MKKFYCIVCCKHKEFKNPKISYILTKTLFLSIICSKCGSKDENILKKEESVKILKIISLINNIEEYQIIRDKNLDRKK